MASPPDPLQALLEQRQQIERALGEHQHDVTTMFTDIVGSTRYFEQKGDIAGLALLQRHNGLLFPLIEQHRGRLVKTIGDAIMAVFAVPDDGVRCAIAMQQALADEPRQPQQEAIHIRIGLHAGRAFTVEQDVYGDAINTASRVAHEAQADEIVISRSTAGVLTDPALRTVERGAVALKGKAEPLELARVLWRGEAPSAPDARSAELFVLEVGHGATGLKVAAVDGDAETGTVKPYAEVAFAPAQLDRAAAAFAQFGPAPASSYRERVGELGAALFEQALPERARQRLRETSLRFLRLQLDDEVVHVPWELMHDGREFLALRFAVGRHVSARMETSPKVAVWRAGGHALVVADATGDLPQAAQEGRAVAGLLRDGFGGPVRLLEGPVTRAQLLEALSGCALLHVAGHALGMDSASPGLVLSDGVLGADALAAAVADRPPMLVFVNACHGTDARGLANRARGLSDLASALLLRGTQHFLGPSLEVPDAEAQTFALRFYEQALAGQALGEAVLHARRALFQSGGPTGFAAYVLYGEPRLGLPAPAVKLAPVPATRGATGRVGAGAVPLSTPPREPPPVRATAAAAPAAQPAAPHAPVSTGARRPGIALIVLGGLCLAAVGIFLGLRASAPPRVELPQPPPTAARPPGEPPRTPDPVVAPPASTTTAAAVPTPAQPPHVGPIRLCVLPFKNVSGDPKLDYLKDAIAESVTTDFGHDPAFKLIENTQIALDIDYLEQTRSKYVDPATREQLGKISGAEVVVLGAYQRAGKQIRANARFVQVATGEVLETVRQDQSEARLFELQDQLATRLRGSLVGVARRLRP